MTIDPRYSVWLSVFLAVLAYLSSASTTLVNLGLSQHVTTVVLALISLLLGIGNTINAVLGSIPSQPGATHQFYLGPKTDTPTPPSP